MKPISLAEDLKCMFYAVLVAGVISGLIIGFSYLVVEHQGRTGPSGSCSYNGNQVQCIIQNSDITTGGATDNPFPGLFFSKRL